MNYALRIFAALFLLASFSSYAATSDTDAKAQKDAEAWLALVDAGQYAESWSAASSLFQNALPKAEWVKGAQSVRAPAGAVKSRMLKSVTPTKEIKGAPAGTYLTVQFTTVFEHMPNEPSATETVTLAQDSDGVFRAAGYAIQ